MSVKAALLELNTHGVGYAGIAGGGGVAVLLGRIATEMIDPSFLHDLLVETRAHTVGPTSFTLFSQLAVALVVTVLSVACALVGRTPLIPDDPGPKVAKSSDLPLLATRPQQDVAADVPRPLSRTATTTLTMPALPAGDLLMFLKLLESTLATAADEAISNPSGGFLGFLQKTPQVAAFYALLLPVAHSYLSKLEPAAGAAPVYTPPAS